MQLSALSSAAKPRTGPGWRFLATLALVASGCGTANDPVDTTSRDSATVGRIRVAIEIDGRDAANAPRLHGQVRVLRYTGVERDTAEILAGDPFGGSLEPGRCELLVVEHTLDDALSRVSSTARVEHLDAGEVRIQAAGVIASAWPTLQPALFPVVDGVEYVDARAEAPLGLGFEDRGPVMVTAFGGVDVGPFDLIAAAPAMPGRVVAERLPGRIEVRWAEPEVDVGAAMIISATAGPGRTLRCRAAAAGSMVLYDGALTGVAAEDPVVLTLERTRRMPFRAPGVSAGTLEVAARYVVTAPALARSLSRSLDSPHE